MDINPYFLAGYNGGENHSLWSSDNWLLHEAGKVFAGNGYSMPVMAKKSRGFSVRVQTSANDFMVKFNEDLTSCTIERK